MTPKQLEKIRKSPYLEKEDFLLQLQINNEPPYVNLKRERDITVYSKFLEENGYDCSPLVDLKKPILEGRWILEAIKTPVERNLDLSQIKDLAGLLGQQIEDEIDFWLEEYEPDLKKIIGKLCLLLLPA